MNATLTIPLQAAIEVATANGWTYNEATETECATVENTDGAIYIADADEPQATADMATVLASIMGNAVNIFAGETVPYTTVSVEVTTGGVEAA